MSPVVAPLPLRAAGILELRKRQSRTAAPMPFGDWMARARADHAWTARHFRVMQTALDDATAGRARRVLFQVPIRHGKTEHNTIGYGAYRLQQNPRTRLLVGSYNQRQAEKLSREIRKLARAQGVAISPDRDAASEWETQAGGGVRAVGAGAGVASINADVIILDDPIGSREDANSAAKREQVWLWLTSDILARAEPHTVVLLSMSRWHVDDLVGRVRERFGDRWLVVDLPGAAEDSDPLGRAPGEPLWPELRDRAWLDEKLVELMPSGFASLIQQRPRPAEGAMFKWEWLAGPGRMVDAAPANATRVRYWDTAGTEADPRRTAHDPDFTVGVLMARRPDGVYFVEHVARGQWGLAQRDAKIVETARADAARYGNSVTQWFEREAGVGGADRTAAIMRALAGITVKAEPATGHKVTRAEPFASQAEAGNVRTVRGDWNTPFLSVLVDFPSGAHDDDVDAAAGAFNKLAGSLGTQWHSVPIQR